MPPEEELNHLIDARLELKLGPINTKLDSIATILNKIEGASIVVKVIFFGVAPIVAAIIWVKDHFK